MSRLRQPCRTQAMKRRHYSYLQCWNYHLLPLRLWPMTTAATYCYCLYLLSTAAAATHYYLLLLPMYFYCCYLLPTATTYLLPMPLPTAIVNCHCLLTQLPTATYGCRAVPDFQTLTSCKDRLILAMVTWRGRPYFYRNSLEIWHSTATIATPTTTAVAVIYCYPCCHYILLRPLPTGVLTGFANYHHSLLPQ